MKTRLTEATIRTLTTDKVQEDHFHSLTPGAGLRVTREGSKTFFMIYNSPTILDPRTGRPLSRRLRLGAHESGRRGQGPYLTLAEFTTLYEILRGDLARKLEPSENKLVLPGKRTRGNSMDVSLVNVPEWLAIKKNTGHQGRPSIGFSDVREGSLNHLLILWFDAAKSSEGKEGALLAPRTLDGYVSTAKTHLIRQLGNMPAVDLTRDQIEDLLDDVKKESRKKIAASAQGENQKVGCAAMVRHILKVISGAYEYARSNVKEFRRIDNPARGIRVRVPKGRRDRCLMDRELATLLPCLDSLSDPMAADIYRIMLYSGCRTGAACEIDSSNIVEHNGEMVWESRHKTDRQHRVPLIGEIGEIINRRLIAVGNKGPLFWHVKPGTRYPAQLKKANKELKKLTAGKIAPFIPYDFRHTMRSNLASLGVRGEVAELALGHAQKGMVQVYQHYDFWKERKAALTLWHEKLQSLIAREEAKAA